MSFFHGSVKRAGPSWSAWQHSFRSPTCCPRTSARCPALCASISASKRRSPRFRLWTGTGVQPGHQRRLLARGVAQAGRSRDPAGQRQHPRVRGDSMIHVSQATALVENTCRCSNSALRQAPASMMRSVISLAASWGTGLVSRWASAHCRMPCAWRPPPPQPRHRYRNDDQWSRPPHSVRRGGQQPEADPHRPSEFTFAMGHAALFAFPNDNDQVEAYPVEDVNAPAVIAQNANVVSVNATLEVDLQGACNSDIATVDNIAPRANSLISGAALMPRPAGSRSSPAIRRRPAGRRLRASYPKLSGPVTTPRTYMHLPPIWATRS